MAGLSLRLPEALGVKLDAEARREGVPRSEVARTAIAELLARRERERVVAACVAEARAAYANPAIRLEARTIAEEALPLDNEALDMAERRSAVQSVTKRRRRPKPPR